MEERWGSTLSLYLVCLGESGWGSTSTVLMLMLCWSTGY